MHGLFGSFDQGLRIWIVEIDSLEPFVCNSYFAIRDLEPDDQSALL